MRVGSGACVESFAAAPKLKEDKMEQITREELVREIEAAREKLNQSINERKKYDEILSDSVYLDSLIEQYIVAGY